MNKKLPKLEVKGFVGYIQYITYLGSYEEYMRSIRRGNTDGSSVKDKIRMGNNEVASSPS